MDDTPGAPPVTAAKEPALPAQPTILDEYVTTFPTDQNALNLFAGEWASRLPPPFDDLKAGGIPLFQDGRLTWALGALGGVRGQSVLDLGPLEGGHDYMLERAGAARVLSIEGNSRAFLKCLIAKELLGLSRTRYVCGDFVEFLDQSNEQFDLIVSSGVLYHMKDPLRLLQLLGSHCRRCYIWTHYYDEQIIGGTDYLRVKFPPTAVEHKEVAGTTFELHRQEYQVSLAQKGFTGGNDEFSRWLTRDGLFTALRLFGFDRIDTSYETPHHPHGPCLSLVATKG